MMIGINTATKASLFFDKLMYPLQCEVLISIDNDFVLYILIVESLYREENNLYILSHKIWEQAVCSNRCK